LPDAGYSVLRVFGAMIVVIAIFFGGIWLFRNWQRFALRKGGAPRLNVIEVRSLGQRHALYVVGYDQQRMLLASSPAGVTLVSHLPAAEEGEAAATAATAVPAPSFAEAFQQVFQRKS
jgi:flagellar biogenesis protein FliO